ncbi:MAG: arsenosugar biosynthesis radical SAM (seleno)protein ArsS [Candidatus Eutrophobiaceae bacterium]
MHDTLPLLLDTDFAPLERVQFETLQVNITLKCNQQCVHCHVNASPKRTEFMSDETLDLVIDVLRERSVVCLDITGGAPELHSGFRALVRRARALGCRVIDRCNLTILLEPGFQGLADFLAEQGVEITASLPCYLAENVERQRGKGVFDKSIKALQRLSSLGYGRDDKRILNLVYNPQGASLPPPQEELENQYKRILSKEYGIHFDRLFVLCNMPIKRFGSMLVSNASFEEYMRTLRNAHQDENRSNVMCRTLLSVDWRGYLYDCDFNQMLNLPMEKGESDAIHLRDLLRRDFRFPAIRTAEHCYACTAGQGSSCGGALEKVKPSQLGEQGS